MSELQEVKQISKKEKLRFRKMLEVQQNQRDRKKVGLIKFFVGVLVVGLVAGASYLWLTAKPQTSGDSHHLDSLGNLKIGDDAPNFSLLSTKGDTISLGAYKGKNILLYFQEGVMCAPCWKQITTIEQRLDKFRELGTEVVSISVDSASTWAPILKAEGITQVPVLIDDDRKVSESYGVLNTPSQMHSDRPGHTFVLVDKEGKVAWIADYPTMRVSEEEILAAISGATGP